MKTHIALSLMVFGCQTTNATGLGLSFGLTPVQLTLAAGQSATVIAAITRDKPDDSVELTVSGLPVGVSLNVEDAQTNTASLVFTAAADASPAMSTLTVIAKSAGKTEQRKTLTLIVTAAATAPDFTFDVSPASVSLAPGQMKTATLNITRNAAFTGALTLTASGPASVSVAINPPTLDASASSATVTITAVNGSTAQTGSITFHAASDALAHDAALSFTIAAGVDGVVVDEYLRGVSGFTARAAGQTATTDANGHFSIAGVGTTPYDLYISGHQGGAPVGYLFKGLTRRDPTLELFMFRGSPEPSTTFTAAGTITNASFPDDAIRQTFATVDLPGIAAQQASAPSGSFSWGASQWAGTGAKSGKAYAFQVLYSGGVINGYNGFGSRAVTANATDALSAQDIALSIITTTSLSGTLANPPIAAALTIKYKTLFPNGAAINIGASAVTGPFTINTPSSSDVRIAVYAALAGTVVDSAAKVVRISPTPANTGFDVAWPQLITINQPANAANVSPSTMFSWTAGAGVYILKAYQTTGGGAFYVITTDTSTTLPDFTPEGIALPTGLFNWNTSNIAALATVDDATAAGALANFCIVADSTFTTSDMSTQRTPSGDVSIGMTKISTFVVP